MSDTSITTIPDAFPATEENFFHDRPPTDEWQEIHNFVMDNIPGVDPDVFTNKLMEIRARHEAELDTLAKSIAEGGSIVEESPKS